jgi:hypothetical protein
MKIYTAMLVISENDDGTGGSVSSMDVIEHKDYFWLVPEWLDYTSQGVSKPVRIVSLKTIPHEKSVGDPGFVVSGPVPKSVFEGQIPPGQEQLYIVIESPDIVVPRTH